MRRFGRPGLMGTMARTAVIAGTATAVVGATSGKKQAQQQQAVAQQQATAQTQQQMAQMQAELDQIHAKEAAEAQQAAIDAAVAERLAAAPAPAANDPVAELQKLAAMKEQGLLDDAEFAAMKAKVLGL